ncbi:MAG TPA: hypothetical protein VMV49_06870 [Candidatus Deferrimicrobium sp.]|nr:hypothetical protein [Candidatus Deferrimicrobium sp.]
MSTAKRNSRRKPHLTRYRHTSDAVNLGIFKQGEKKNHAVRDGPFSYEFFHGVIENTRDFDKTHRDFIFAYQVIIYAVDLDDNREFSFTVQNLRAPRYKQNDEEVFKGYEEKARDILNQSSKNYQIRFMRIILVSHKSKKQLLDFERKVRSEKQAIGKAEAKRERELIAREKELSRIRKEKEKNKKLRELGLIAPAKKKPYHKRKVWI